MVVTWDDIVVSAVEDFPQLRVKVKEARTKEKVYPEGKDVFRYTKVTRIDKLKAVIITNDPYKDDNADGLAFSSKDELTPELKLIYKRLYNELYSYMTFDEFKNIVSPNLDHWAKEGILLLNYRHTIGENGKHSTLGWEAFTKRVLENLSSKIPGLCYILLGTEELIQLKPHIKDSTANIIFSPIKSDVVIFKEMTKTASKLGFSNHIIDVDYEDCIDFNKIQQKYINELKDGFYTNTMMSDCLNSIEKLKKAIHRWIPIYQSIKFI